MKFRTAIVFTSALILLSACAGLRKVDVALTLKQCKPQLDSAEIYSIEIDTSLFPRNATSLASLLPNPEVIQLGKDILAGRMFRTIGNLNLRIQATIVNPSTDSLWIDAAKGSIQLDSSIQAQWKLMKPFLLKASSGSPVEVLLTVPINGALFQILETKQMHLEGALGARTSMESEAIVLEYERTDPSPTDFFQEKIAEARQRAFEQLLESWKNSIL